MVATVELSPTIASIDAAFAATQLSTNATYLPTLHRQDADAAAAYLCVYLQTDASYSLEAVKIKPEQRVRP